MKTRQGGLSARLLLHLLVIRPALRLVFGVNVRGREHLQGLESFVMVANHNSHLDVLLLFCALPLRRVASTFPVASRDYFARFPWLFTAIDRLFRPIWVDRRHRPADALHEMSRRLDAGAGIVLFPEGTRGEPGRIEAFKTGIGRLVEKHPGVPVLPVFILGPERALPRRTSLPLPLWNHVIVGPPQLPRGTAAEISASLQTTLEGLARSEAASRHRRRAPRPDPRVVAVLGIDGSGKSTLSRLLARELSRESGVACLIGDAVEVFVAGAASGVQPLLTDRIRAWLGGQAKRARSLAGYKVPKLAEMLLRDRLAQECRRWYDAHYLVLDGSPLLNLTAWAALYRERLPEEEALARVLAVLSGRARVEPRDPLLREFPELGAMQRARLARLEVPDAVVFLDVAPAVAVARIESHGHRRQVHETEEKLAYLRRAYVSTCAAAERALGVPVRTLEGERAIESLLAESLDFAAGGKEGSDVR